MVIYKAINRINGKIYIGQTIRTLKRRIIEHSKANPNCNIHFHNALKKYSIENFRWQVICICPDINSLNEQEQYYIALYDSINSGYNLTSGGLNYIVTDETRKRIGIAKLGNKNPMYGKHRSDKTKEKIRQTARNMSDETRQRKSEVQKGKNNSFYNKHHSIKTRLMMRESRLKYLNKKQQLNFT